MPVIELVDSEQRTIGTVTCPNCRVAMRLTFIKPVDGGLALRETVYRCPRCDAETRRWVSP
jgi:hypothetical protein